MSKQLDSARRRERGAEAPLPENDETVLVEVSPDAEAPLLGIHLRLLQTAEEVEEIQRALSRAPIGTVRAEQRCLPILIR
jgi:hypothetical protein